VVGGVDAETAQAATGERLGPLQTGALGDAHARRVAAADAVLQPVLGSRAHQEARLTPSLRSLKTVPLTVMSRISRSRALLGVLLVVVSAMGAGFWWLFSAFFGGRH
jgi:hypothetical protein